MKNIMMVLAIIVIVFLRGCHRTGIKQMADEYLTDYQVLSIAKCYIQKKEAWADRAVYKATQKKDGMWHVFVKRVSDYENGQPAFSMGGHRLLIVDINGKIIDYIIGR